YPCWFCVITSGVYLYPVGTGPTRAAYARAEKLAEGDLFGIAEELDQPAWLVRDYQESLAKECGRVPSVLI
ncbi:hypothetical protein, partial [Aerococcus sp. UMB8623]|uniref:hypothetical protein n=1 Tax=Aerococcus sp. UMB8623 TaxID=3046348 RepID=UPI002550401F